MQNFEAGVEFLRSRFILLKWLRHILH